MAWIFDDVLDKFRTKAYMTVLGKAADVVGSDFGKWFENFGKQLGILGFQDLLDFTLKFGGVVSVPPMGKPSEIMAQRATAKGVMKQIAASPLGMFGVVKGLLDLGSAGPIQALIQEMNYDTRFTSPLWLPDGGTLVTGKIKAEKPDEYAMALRLQGYGTWAQAAFEDAARQRLAPSDYWTLSRRGKIGTGEALEPYLNHAGMFEKDRAFLDALNVRLPGLAELWVDWRRNDVPLASREKDLFLLGYRKEDAGFYDKVLRLDMPVDALTLLKRHGFIDEGTYQKRLQQVGYRPADLAALVNAAWVYPGLSDYYGLERRGVITMAELRDGLKGIGFSPADVGRMEHLRHEVPDPRTVIEWRRRGLIDDAGQTALFKAAGLSTSHTAHMKELTWLIPGAADLVTMAVREAFTPKAIEKYGLHEDFPDEFRKWGEKVGLSEEWAKAYWAAHWRLPGVNQVFEMFHRIDRKTGEPLISEDEMDDFLKVADISPHWRPLLRGISYTPFTRIDVRRMYKAEAVDEDEVFNTYRDLGYEKEKARQLTEWVKEAYRPEKTDLTRSDILDAYRKGLFPRLTAANYLDMIGIREGDAIYYLNRTEYLIEKDLKEVTLANLKAMYLAGLIGLGEIRDRMHKDNYAEGEIARLIRLWQTENEKKVAGKAAKLVKPTRGDLDRFLRLDVITLDEYAEEMADLGYSDRYIGMYAAAVYYGMEGG